MPCSKRMWSVLVWWTFVLWPVPIQKVRTEGWQVRFHAWLFMKPNFWKTVLIWSKTWQLKQADYLAAVRADQSLISMDASGIFPFISSITAFENEWDVLPNGRQKTIHPVGAICPFEIVIIDTSPYTGLLKVSVPKFNFVTRGRQYRALAISNSTYTFGGLWVSTLNYWSWVLT